MKIKQVCELTGLTPRAVRFYTEKGLLPPGEEKAYGRTLREYTAEDVHTLQDIVTLRENDFTVQEILSMQQDARAVEPLVQARIAQLQEKLRAGQNALQCLNTETGHRGDWRMLAKNLRPTGAAPNAEPDFSRLQDEEEWVLQQIGQPKPRSKFLRLFAVLAAVVLLFIIWEPAVNAFRGLEKVSVIFTESDVHFTKVRHDGVGIVQKGEYPSVTNLFKLEQIVAVDGVDTSALFEHTDYCCVTLRIEMPRHIAELHGLLSDSGYLDLNRIHSFSQVSGHIWLVDVHAG